MLANARIGQRGRRGGLPEDSAWDGGAGSAPEALHPSFRLKVVRAARGSTLPCRRFPAASLPVGLFMAWAGDSEVFAALSCALAGARGALGLGAASPRLELSQDARASRQERRPKRRYLRR